jgi:hypothetical protein
VRGAAAERSKRDARIYAFVYPVDTNCCRIGFIAEEVDQHILRNAVADNVFDIVLKALEHGVTDHGSAAA